MEQWPTEPTLIKRLYPFFRCMYETIQIIHQNWMAFTYIIIHVTGCLLEHSDQPSSTEEICDISHSNQCYKTGVTKVVVCDSLSVRRWIPKITWEMGNSQSSGGSKFLFSLSEWSFTICHIIVNKMCSFLHPLC